jgi:Flp pilus assembly protein TadG
MRRTLKEIGRRYERGAIAIEAAIVLPILLLIVLFPSVKLAFFFRQYSAEQKAVHDAALYLSTAPRTEMITAGADGNPAALTLAQTIMTKEMTGLVPSGTSLNPSFVCLYRVAANPLMTLCTVANNQDPTYTLLQIGVSMRVTFVDPLTGIDNGQSITSYAPVSYLGN